MPPKPKKVTRGSASQKQRQYIKSLAKATSPPKVRKPKKSPEKQALFESPEVAKITPQVVTVPKKKSESSSEESSNDDNSNARNSTGNENASVMMASNLTAGADPRLDKKFDYVLDKFLLAKGGNHEIRQMFKEENIYQFEDFVGYEVEDLEDLRQKFHDTQKGFAKRKVIQVYNVIRYYKFL